MDLIYERAIMTVVAAAGGNANAGLPRVREGNRFITQHVEQIKPGVKLAVYSRDVGREQRPSDFFNSLAVLGGIITMVSNSK